MTRPDPASESAAGDAAGGYAVDWAHRAGAVDEILGELAMREARQRRRRRMLLGSGLTTALVAALFFHFSRPQPVPPAPVTSAIVSTPERRVLPDGSIVELREGAQIVVAFTADSVGPRRVGLQRGVAHFAVAKNKERPFIVTVGGVEVRAVGTAFSVDFGRKQIEVIVTEGRVAVDGRGAGPTGATHGLDATAQTLATVDAGSRVVVPVPEAGLALAAGPIEPVPPAEMAERMAWRVPRLEFSGTPLAEALVMFNQHNEVKFVLADESLGRLQVSGFLRADKTETFLLLLETDFGLKAEARGPHEILLRRP